MQAESVENVFARSWSLLAKNWIIIVPGVVVGLVAGIIDVFLLPPADVTSGANGADPATAVAGMVQLFLRAAIGLAVAVLSFLITETYITGMAGAAWNSGVATLADGSASFREDSARLLGAIVLLAVLIIVAGMFTFGIGSLVVLFFAIYMAPAVVLDNHGAFNALKLSATIARKRAVATIIIVILLFVISVAVNLLALPLVFIPFLGPIAVMVVSQAVAAYATLVIVGEYLSAHRSPDIIAARP